MVKKAKKKLKPILVGDESSMDAKEFKSATAALEIPMTKIGPALGVSVRHAQRMSAGDSEVPPTVRKLLRLAMATSKTGKDLEAL